MTFERMATMTRANFHAFETADRAAIEAIIGDPFSFTTPFEDHFDRADYFAHCWSKGAGIFDRFEIEHLVPAGADGVMVLYQARLKSGKLIRNAEYHRFAHGKLTSVEVFFGLAPGEPTTSPDRW